MKKIKVWNMTSKNGNDIANQFVIRDSENNCSYFQSYNSIIAKIDSDNNIWLDKEYWNYSNTTSKYRNMFLDMATQTIKQAIKQGTIKLVNLN